MNHLIISREYPPAAYIGGGIGTYVDHISTLLAEHGETVHVIGQLCPAAPHAQEIRAGGRLIVHRVPGDIPLALVNEQAQSHKAILDAFRHSAAACRAFLWQAALLAESLIESEAIDIVEAQEYEAPFYFLMLRQAFGLGPHRRVPLVVHLHSPTEFIFTENERQNSPDYETMKRLEEYTIRAADALVCPSRFLADVARSRYRLERSTVEVIPYPIGCAVIPVRSDATWRHGSISFVGRLEPRKGVKEWVDAATAIAARDPSARFSFVGADTTVGSAGDRSMRSVLRTSIPAALRSRFVFSEAIPRHRLAAHREQARMAVVPSRWENFPYTCIEAMASGLPVLASPNGGMAEMIEDGRTGWIAAGADARSLEVALRRALSTPAHDLAVMGAAAAASIGTLCDNDEIVRRHLAFKGNVVARGGRALVDTLSLPASLPEPIDVRLSQTTQRGTQRSTMTPMEILRAPRAQQVAVIRRALSNPAYVGRWVAWHARRFATSWAVRQ